MDTKRFNQAQRDIKYIDKLDKEKKKSKKINGKLKHNEKGARWASHSQK